jgi:nickel superoxide dismutase
MVKKIEELKPPASAAGTKEWFEFENAVTRLVKVKEEHAETCKHQVLILWTDYFKPEHLKKFPDLHEDVWKTTKLCSKNKQSVDAAAAKELREAVERIADYFGQAEQSKAK